MFGHIIFMFCCDELSCVPFSARIGRSTTKVGGVIVTGNEDGAHSAAETTLFNFCHFGCTIPPSSDCYWVGDAGPGLSYLEAGGDKHMYTNKTARFMAHNLVHVAKLLRENPIKTSLKALTEEARAYSDDECPDRHGR